MLSDNLHHLKPSYYNQISRHPTGFCHRSKLRWTSRGRIRNMDNGTRIEFTSIEPANQRSRQRNVRLNSKFFVTVDSSNMPLRFDAVHSRQKILQNWWFRDGGSDELKSHIGWHRQVDSRFRREADYMLQYGSEREQCHKYDCMITIVTSGD